MLGRTRPRFEKRKSRTSRKRSTDKSSVDLRPPSIRPFLSACSKRMKSCAPCSPREGTNSRQKSSPPLHTVRSVSSSSCVALFLFDLCPGFQGSFNPGCTLPSKSPTSPPSSIGLCASGWPFSIRGGHRPFCGQSAQGSLWKDAFSCHVSCDRLPEVPRRIRQTDLAWLLPPKLRTKGRF